MSCTNNVSSPKYLRLNNTKYNQSREINTIQPNYAWTDITYLLHKNNPYPKIKKEVKLYER